MNALITPAEIANALPVVREVYAGPGMYEFSLSGRQHPLRPVAWLERAPRRGGWRWRHEWQGQWQGGWHYAADDALRVLAGPFD